MSNINNNNSNEQEQGFPIYLKHDKIALVSENVWEAVKRYKWYQRSSDGYVVRNMSLVNETYFDKKANSKRVAQKTILLHRFVQELIGNELDKKEVVNHINGDRLNNTFSNLRIVNHLKNNHNRKTVNKNNKSGYNGVTERASGRFNATVTINYIKMNLGMFNSAEEAYKAVLTAKEAI